MIMSNFLWWLPSSPDLRNEESKPPRNSSFPEKKVIEGHKNALPPSTRDNLGNASASLAAAQSDYLRVDGVGLRKSLMPFNADYRECGPSTYTVMGVSMEEIKELGDFPDYAALSEVPLPKPYTNFEIDKARSRPYRPFRWAYHQNMCMSLQAISKCCLRLTTTSVVSNGARLVVRD